LRNRTPNLWTFDSTKSLALPHLRGGRERNEVRSLLFSNSRRLLTLRRRGKPKRETVNPGSPKETLTEAGTGFEGGNIYFVVAKKAKESGVVSEKGRT